MIGVDTNVLLRFLVQDDRKQAAAAKEFFQQAKDRSEQIAIDRVVLCELTWVLETGYRYGKKEIVGLLQRILSTKQFDVENKSCIWRALDDYSSKPVDFADCVIGRSNAALGAEATVTFDRALKNLGYFRVLA